MTYNGSHHPVALKANEFEGGVTNVLVIGFSVTEMPSSYFPIAQRMINNSGLNVRIVQCGIGGITPESLVYIVDEVVSKHLDCKAVIFEIATSYVRDVYNSHIEYNENYKREIWSQIEKLILATRSKGMEVAFLNLPRKDVNYVDDMLEGIISKVACCYNAKVLSISNEILIKSLDVSSLFLDEVHPGPFLANFYAERLVAFIPMVLSGVKYASVSEGGRYNCIDLSGHVTQAPEVFRRHGFQANNIRLKEGEDICLEFEDELSFEGFAVLCGPRSGRLIIETDQKFEFLCYDEFCYYERVMTCVKPMGTSRKVTFKLLPEIPSVELRKGVANTEKREMGLLYLFTK